jgi:acetylornithine deacetylase/succinyl-diaminopimelate desuccinylase-like protein
MNDIYAWIDAHQDEMVEELQRLLQQPSISAQQIGLEECAIMVQDMMLTAGISDVQIYPTPGGPEVVYGRVPGEQGKTMLCYAHYDVQPPGPEELWSRPPFAAEIEDGVIIARGATDNKSGLLAFVRAAQAFLEVRGRPPVSLKFIFEGEEEVGSPHLSDWLGSTVLVANGQPMIAADLVRADAMHCLDGGIDGGTGRPRVSLGNKAILYAELHCRGAKAEIHSGDSAWVINPAWRLVQALNTLLDAEGRVAVPGWYDDWDAPTEEDIAWLEKALADFDLQQKMDILGVDSLPPGKTALDLLVDRAFGATCTICGIEAGYTGPGAKTAVPPSAMCKLDFRCPPYLDPLVQLEKLKAHLAAGGFDDVEVQVITARRHPWRTPQSAAIARAIIRAAESVFGQVPFVQGVTAEGTIISHVPMPTVLTGFGPIKANLHAPDENIPVVDYIRGIKYAATIMEEYGQEVE